MHAFQSMICTKKFHNLIVWIIMWQAARANCLIWSDYKSLKSGWWRILHCFIWLITRDIVAVSTLCQYEKVLKSYSIQFNSKDNLYSAPLWIISIARVLVLIPDRVIVHGLGGRDESSNGIWRPAMLVQCFSSWPGVNSMNTARRPRRSEDRGS